MSTSSLYIEPELQELILHYRLAKRPQYTTLVRLFEGSYEKFTEFFAVTSELGGWSEELYDEFLALGSQQDIGLVSDIQVAIHHAHHYDVQPSDLASYAYYAASTVHPSEGDDHVELVLRTDAAYFSECFDGGSWLIDDNVRHAAHLAEEGVPAAYAREIPGGVKDVFKYLGEGSLYSGDGKGYAHAVELAFPALDEIVAFHRAGVPVEYVSALCWDARKYMGADHLSPKPNDIIRLFQAGVPHEYARPAAYRGVSVPAIAEAWADGIPAEYLMEVTAKNG